MYCVDKDKKINPRSMNTDIVEWFSGDAHQFVGGSTNKMTARGMDYAGAKATACNKGKHNLVGNNKTGENMFDRKKRF